MPARTPDATAAAMLARYHAGATTADLAAAYGLSPAGAYRAVRRAAAAARVRLRARGHQKRRGHRGSRGMAARDAAIYEAYRLGAAVRDIAAAAGVSAGRVDQIVAEEARRRGVARPRRERPHANALGERNAAVAADYQSGGTLESVGRRHGLCLSRVKMIVVAAQARGVDGAACT
jgi:hypothetical protein